MRKIPIFLSAAFLALSPGCRMAGFGSSSAPSRGAANRADGDTVTTGSQNGPGSDDERETASTQTLGTNRFAINLRPDCSFQDVHDRTYEVNCRVVDLREGDEELVAAPPKDTAIRFQEPEALDGAEIRIERCSRDDGALAPCWQVTLAENAGPVGTRIRVDMQVTTPQKTEVVAQTLTLPFSVGAYGALVQIPRYYVPTAGADVLADAAAQIKMGFQTPTLWAAENAPLGLVFSHCFRGAELYFSSANFIYAVSGGKLRLFAGSGNAADVENYASRFSIAMGRGLMLACGKDGLFVADTLNHRVLSVPVDGPVVLMAGKTGQAGRPGVEDGLLNEPVGIAYRESDKALFVGDSRMYVVRRIGPDKTQSIVAGNGEGELRGDGGPAVSASVNGVLGLAVAGDDLLLADTWNHRIRRIDKNGVITTVAGTSRGFAGDNGPAKAAKLHYPYGVGTGSDGSILIADTYNHRVRQVSPQGIITTVTGGGGKLDYPYGATSGPDGAVYIDDTMHRQLKKLVGSSLGVVAGAGGARFDPAEDGKPASRARFSNPNGIALGSDGSIYIADAWNHRIRRIRPDANVVTVAGAADPAETGPDSTGSFAGDGGPAIAARLHKPSDVAVGPGGVLYVADTFNNRIRRVDASGVIVTVAGKGTRGFSGDGGAATAAQLNRPYGVTVDGAGNLYVADTCNNRIRRIDPSGKISTVAGSSPPASPPTGNGDETVPDPCRSRDYYYKPGSSGDGGPAVNALLHSPTGVAVVGNRVYIADTANQRIRVVDETGRIATVLNTAGDPLPPQDYMDVDPRVRGLARVTADSEGKLYVVDTFRGRVLHFDPLTPAAAPAVVVGGARSNGGCASGIIEGTAAAGEIGSSVATAMNVMCYGQPLALAYHDGCAAGGSITFAFPQVFDFGIMAGNVVRVTRPCPR